MSAVAAIDVRFLLISFWVATIIIGFALGVVVGIVSEGGGK